jgi:hypothetical protein
MSDRAALPKRVKHSEKLDRLNRLKRDFACRPAIFDNERWADMRITGSYAFETHKKDQHHKHMIKEVQQGVKGLGFPAEEMAMIIRGWMAQDD